jgi:hypothetical protein
MKNSNPGQRLLRSLTSVIVIGEEHRRPSKRPIPQEFFKKSGPQQVQFAAGQHASSFGMKPTSRSSDNLQCPI